MKEHLNYKRKMTLAHKICQLDGKKFSGIPYNEKRELMNADTPKLALRHLNLIKKKYGLYSSR